MPVLRGQMEPNDGSAGRNRRIRRPISCLSCRHRKLRCDRALPACSNCVNRGDITTCCYSSRKAESSTKPQQSLGLPEAAQRKIDHLEHLVRTLLKSHQPTRGQVDTPSGSVGASNDENDGQIDVDKRDQESHVKPNQRMTTGLANLSTAIKISADYKQSLSVDEAHWSLLLNEISDVRSYLYAQQKQYEEQTEKISQILRPSSADPGPTLLFGSARNVSRSEILSQLPSRYSCDIMVTRFFAHLYPAIYILHRPTFHKQYEAFWADKSNTSIVWVALLFAILRIAMLDYIREGDEPIEYEGKCQDLAANFRMRLTDCMILADYMQPHDFLIEALILHLYAEYVSTRDAKSSIWVLIGMIVRLAMRMGYHQPSQPSLTSTPFKVEMRRRAWAFIRQADIMLSFQVGLPSMIGLHSPESSLPRNIYDNEGFSEDCIALPTALPDSEPTEISYLIAKTKLVFGFARAVKEVNRANPVRWERILEIDRELRHIYDNIPSHYKLGQLSKQGSLVLVSSRFSLSSIHHKSLCVIHSRFLEIAKSDYKYMYSRRVCLSSAMSLLRFQAIQNQKIPVDGCLRSLTNYQTSLAIHDYLLAATIISADLCSNTSTGNLANGQVSHGVPTRADMIKALDISTQIFSQMGNQSVEAYKAADVLGMLVKKFGAAEHNTVEREKELQTSHAGGPCWLEGDRLVSKPVSSRLQTVPQILSSATDNFSSTGFNAGTNQEKILPGQPQHLFRGPSSVSQSTHTDGSTVEKYGLLERTDSCIPSSWSEPQASSFRAQPSSSALKFPGLVAPESWAMSDDIDPFAVSYQPTLLEVDLSPEGHKQSMPEDRNFGTTSSGTGDSSLPFYSTALALTDPVSTLWNLNSWTEEGFP